MGRSQTWGVTRSVHSGPIGSEKGGKKGKRSEKKGKGARGQEDMRERAYMILARLAVATEKARPSNLIACSMIPLLEYQHCYQIGSDVPSVRALYRLTTPNRVAIGAVNT